MWIFSSFPFAFSSLMVRKKLSGPTENRHRNGFFILCHRLPYMPLVKSHHHIHQFIDWKGEYHVIYSTVVRLQMGSSALLPASEAKGAAGSGCPCARIPWAVAPHHVLSRSTWQDSSWSLHFQAEAFKFDPFKSLKFTRTITSAVQSNPGLRWK